MGGTSVSLCVNFFFFRTMSGCVVAPDLDGYWRYREGERQIEIVFIPLPPIQVGLVICKSRDAGVGLAAAR